MRISWRSLRLLLVVLSARREACLELGCRDAGAWPDGRCSAHTGHAPDRIGVSA